MTQDQGQGGGSPQNQQPVYGQPPAGQQQPAGQQPPGQQPPQWAPPQQPTQSGWPSKYCPSCGATVDSRAEVCPHCGVRQPDAVVGESKSRPLAIVLALLLGNFGIHRFYVGPVAWGIAYLVFFWTGIPGIIAWFEALYWLTRSDVEWAQKYGGAVHKSNGVAIGCLWILALLPLIAIVLSFTLIFAALPFGL